MFKNLFNSKKSDYRNWVEKQNGVYWHKSVQDLPVFARSEQPATDIEKQVMDMAISIISQTPTGRYLLEKSKKSLKSIDFIRQAPNATPDGMGKTFARFGYLKRNKFNDVEIHILSPHHHSNFTPDKLHEVAIETATLLVHELAHCLQYQHKRVYASHMYTPLNFIALNLATEADAYAHEQQFARELFVGDPKGPAAQYTSFDAVINLMTKNRFYTRHKTESLEDAKKLDDGTLMAEAFLHFYTRNNLRNYYTQKYTGYLSQLLGSIEKSSNKMLRATAMKAPIDDSFIKHFFQNNGTSYLKKHLPKLKIVDNPLFCGVDVSLEGTIRRIYKRRGQLLTSSKEINEVLDQDGLFIDFSKDGFVSNPENPFEVVFKTGIANDNKPSPKPQKNHARP